MKTLLIKGLNILAISSLLAACQTTDLEEDVAESDVNEQTTDTDTEENEPTHNGSNDHDAPEDVDIQGLADHYHTGDAIELTAELEEGTEYDHWHWYIRDDHDAEWETVPEQGSADFKGEATVDGQEIKAVLLNADHEAYVQSAPVEIVVDDHDDHSHNHDEESQRIYEGYFDDHQVEDRSLSDWSRDWQSVYPYLQDDTLDEVFDHKANEEDSDMTAGEYKEYYEVGYETDVERIVIEDNHVTFFKNDEEQTGEYTYNGYEILTYEAGNRGVRYTFELTEDKEEMPQFIQFSDHSISPTEAHHFHLYWGDDDEELLDEVTNWPTYYPSEMDDQDIVHEMIAH